MALALRGAALSDGDSPVDEALTSIGSVLSNLGSEVSGLAMRHTREVAYLRAESSWLASELEQLRKVRQKPKPAKRGSSQEVSVGSSRRVSKGSVDVSCPCPGTLSAEPVVTAHPQTLPALPPPLDSSIATGNHISTPALPALPEPVLDDEMMVSRVMSTTRTTIKARCRSNEQSLRDSVKEERSIRSEPTIPGEETIALLSAGAQDPLPAAGRRKLDASREDACETPAGYFSMPEDNGRDLQHFEDALDSKPWASEQKVELIETCTQTSHGLADFRPEEEEECRYEPSYQSADQGFTSKAIETPGEAYIPEMGGDQREKTQHGPNYADFVQECPPQGALESMDADYGSEAMSPKVSHQDSGRRAKSALRKPPSGLEKPHKGLSFASEDNERRSADEEEISCSLEPLKPEAAGVPVFAVCKDLSHSAKTNLIPGIDDVKTMTWRQSNTEKSIDNSFHHRHVPRRCCCIMSPVAPFRLVWESTGLIILVYDMVMIPMQAFDLPQSNILLAMSWACLYYWTFDVFFTFMVGYYSAEGKLVMEFLKIAARYIQTWLALDLMIIGVDWFSIIARLLATGVYAMESNSSAEQNLAVMRVGKVLRVLRLVRLLRVMKLSRSNFFLMMQERLASQQLFVVSNLLKNVSVLIVVSHFCACGWFAIGSIRIQGYGCWTDEYEMHKYNWVYGYLTSVHWALAQFANGEVLIEPQNIPERLMCVFVLMASLVIFSSFVAIVGNTVQQLIQRKAQLRNQQWMMRLYLRQHDISLDLKMRVIRYIGVMTDNSNNRISSKDVKLIELLSRPLQIELQTELFLKHLIMHPFFVLLSKRSFNITRTICCEAVRQVLLSRGDTLFGVGEEVHLMYFVTVGALQYAPHHKAGGGQGKTWSASPEENNFFCEAVLWTDRWLSCGTMRAETECELVGLNGPKFREVMTQYHTANMLLPKDYAEAFVQSLNWSLKGEGMNALSDVQTHLVLTPEVQVVLSKYSINPTGHDAAKLKRALPRKAYLNLKNRRQSDFRDSQFPGRNVSWVRHGNSSECLRPSRIGQPEDHRRASGESQASTGGMTNSSPNSMEISTNFSILR